MVINQHDLMLPVLSNTLNPEKEGKGLEARGNLQLLSIINEKVDECSLITNISSQRVICPSKNARLGNFKA